ncbi:Hcp1 family type VI secretion system effector [Erwinia sp. OLTSP20]|uniref:Hcp family type VI secretion system effector n=1 Tax=unclassified Erwinia TaxID=2622719 RepID=UPI000C187931|nr:MULTISPECIES: Hcp family type VI secretion system effector [unclassified Erwinia]PIJ49614.1 Hcp1 family type VI secretion system effector [Erwinia sp. OAMSP11]PIJ71611.1 Hcp1 family type VI secretion system effector [Erwinia sp. OLSSP12]PIJ82681.1 Hcp1 family type VI secretion system effector [Erwinia sp. OLCASP19]PIJ83148.1 Hcp1 family type VI secretion system effector [Erwinia sp. OLMTSP26]PIJ85314.1 Hcp1 family type VI secretion system effector [Erwinia sp. OLMDSP33]
MAQDMFIKIDGIDGESLDSNHKDEIQVLAWKWDVSQHSNMHSGSGGGSGKASVSDFLFEHYTDKASPNLLSYCLSGKHIKNIKFVVRKAGGNPLEYLTIKFTDVIITHVEMLGSISDETRPRESVKFSFTKMTQDYVMQNAEGHKSGTISASYDVKANLNS